MKTEEYIEHLHDIQNQLLKAGRLDKGRFVFKGVDDPYYFNLFKIQHEEICKFLGVDLKPRGVLRI